MIGRLSILIAAALVWPLAAVQGETPPGRLVGLVELPSPEDGLSPQQLAHIEAAIAAHERRQGIKTAQSVDAPFRVVSNANQAKNRPPNKIKARLTRGAVTTCTVETSLVSEDPDYDVVSYRYEWKVNGKVVRSVTSAGLSDLLPAVVARAHDKVSCRVIPNDGKKNGPAATAGKNIDG
jgi:hypothetical protein